MKDFPLEVLSKPESRNDSNSLEHLLPLVQKPARYIGDEINIIRKDPADVKLRMALAFPDVYEVGMSHLGLKILYSIVNARPDLAAERVFAPWPDMEDLLRKTCEPLRTLESGTPLSEFHMVGFSLQYELCATTVLQMLDLGGIPLRAEDRGPGDPIVIAGGPAAFNPIPLSPFFDAFAIGEGEDLILELADCLIRCKDQGVPRNALLAELKQVEGLFVPALHDPGEAVSRRIVADLERADFPLHPVVPYCETVHDRVGIEIARGCTRGCRFCQAGMLYRPVREREASTIVELAGKGIAHTGWDDVALLSLSSGDYSCISELIETMVEDFGPDMVALSLPSLRTETFSAKMAEQIRKVRKTGFTLAPEAGTDRLRGIINKGNTEQDMENAVRTAFDAGWRSLKLYFMIGLPMETDEDLDGIIELIRKASKWAAGGKITASISTFVPKSHTPFQWADQMSIEETRRCQQYISRHFRKGRTRVKFHDARISFLEGVLARGDQALSGVIEAAFKMGARLDGWDEHLKFDVWMDAFAEQGVEPEKYLRAREALEVLPWDLIQSGVSRQYLLQEWERARSGAPTGDCRFDECEGCGVCDFEEISPRITQSEPVELGKPSRETNSRSDKEHERAKVSVEESPLTPLFQRGGPAPPPFSKGGQGGFLPSGLEPYVPSLKTHWYQSEGSDSSDAAVRRFRLRYAKINRMRFLGHQDVVRAFHRAFRRARIRLDYSKGFHPHPRLRFSPPLSLGLESVAEYLDFDIQDSNLNTQETFFALEESLPSGLKPMELEEISLNSSPISDRIKGFIYQIKSFGTLSSGDVGARVTEFESSETCVIIRQHKGKTKSRDLKEHLENLEFSGESMTFTLKVGRSGAVNPLDASAAVLGLPRDETRTLKIFKIAAVL